MYKVYDVKEWTIIRGIRSCPKKPTATATAAAAAAATAAAEKKNI